MNRQAAKPHSCKLPAISSNLMTICQIVFMNQHFLDGEMFQHVAFQMEDLRFLGKWGMESPGEQGTKSRMRRLGRGAESQPLIKGKSKKQG